VEAYVLLELKANERDLELVREFVERHRHGLCSFGDTLIHCSHRCISHDEE
jgi:hypothetical protein